eukprot:4450391-Lingulodinium_polyedra.AAC.1
MRLFAALQLTVSPRPLRRFRRLPRDALSADLQLVTFVFGVLLWPLSTGCAVRGPQLHLLR